MSSRKDKKISWAFNPPLEVSWHVFCFRFISTRGKKIWMSQGEFDEKIVAGITHFGLYVVRDTDRQNRDKLLAKSDF